ncbi:IclR family transcriptional regulator [Candidatus Aerophobetes bacterium Ae_b3a]|nr:MAG: IclR family transcriptional regulator [Candidatus Aerophobetes bacterium Ae_b3a]
MSKKEPSYPLKALDKSLAILEILFQENSPLSIAELSKRLGIYPSTIHRILDTLRYWEYVEQDSHTQRYQLGLKVLELGMAKLHGMELAKEAASYLKELQNQSNETVHLAILEEGEVLYLDKEESSQSIRMVSKVGRRVPAHCTGLGKVLLAYLDQEEQEKVIKEKGLSRFTENTITNKKKLREELSKVREQGFAEDREEHEKDVRCLAAPIKDHRGTVIAAVSLSAPAFRMNASRKRKLKKTLIQAGEAISKRLGYNRTRGTTSVC